MKHPIPNVALDDRIAIVGTSGSGKTYGAGSAVERLLAKKARVCVIDPTGAWWGLGLDAAGKRPSTPRAKGKLIIFGGEHGDLPLGPQSGALMGETIATMAESCILDLSEMGSDAEQRRFVLALLNALFKHKVRDLLHVVFDEADMWAPQIILDKDGEAPKLLGTMQKIVKRGRIFGFIPWLITQNPAGIAKSVLGQVSGMIAFSLTSSQDRDAIGNWVKGQADVAQWKEIWSTMPTLETGRALVWLPRRRVFKIESFPPKTTFDSSRAPKRGERVRKRRLKPINLKKLQAKLGAVEAELKANDPKALKAENAKLRTENRALESKFIKHAATSNFPTVETTKAAEQRGVAAGKRAAYDEFERDIRAVLDASHKAIVDKIEQALKGVKGSIVPVETWLKRIAKQKKELKSGSSAVSVSSVQPRSAAPRTLPPEPVVRATSPGPATSGDVTLTPAMKETLAALAWWTALGHDAPTRQQLGGVLGVKPDSSTMRSRLGPLAEAGLVAYPSNGRVKLTAAGHTAAPQPDLSRSLIETVRDSLTTAERETFDAIPASGSITREDLARALNIEDPKGSTMRSRLGPLSNRALITYPEPLSVARQDWVQ